MKSNSVLATPQRYNPLKDGRGGDNEADEEPLSPLVFSGQLTGAGAAWNGDDGGGGGQWKEPTTPLVKAAAVAALGHAGTNSHSDHNNNGTVSRGNGGGGGLSSGSTTYRQLASASSALTHSSRLNSRRASRRASRRVILRTRAHDEVDEVEEIESTVAENGVGERCTFSCQHDLKLLLKNSQRKYTCLLFHHTSCFRWLAVSCCLFSPHFLRAQVSTASSGPSWHVRPCSLPSLLKGGPLHTTTTALVEAAAAEAAPVRPRDLVLQGGTYVGGSAGPWGAKLKQLIADFVGAKYGRAFEVCKTAHQRLVAAFPNTTSRSSSESAKNGSLENAPPAPTLPLCLPWESPTFVPPVVHARRHPRTVRPEHEEKEEEEDLDAIEEQARQKEALAARKKLARRARRRVFWVMDAPNRAQDRAERRAKRAVISNALATRRANVVLKEASRVLQEHSCMAYEDALSREAAIKAAAAAAGRGKVTRVVQGPSAAAQMMMLGGRSGGKNNNSRSKQPQHSSSNRLSRENSTRLSSSRPGSPNVDNRSSSSAASTPGQRGGPDNSDAEDNKAADNFLSGGVGGYVDSNGIYHSDSSGDSNNASYATDDSLPEGWHEAFDERSYAPYWVHAHTGESTWERPLSPNRARRRRHRHRSRSPPDPSVTVSYVLPSICFEPWPVEEKELLHTSPVVA